MQRILKIAVGAALALACACFGAAPATAQLRARFDTSTVNPSATTAPATSPTTVYQGGAATTAPSLSSGGLAPITPAPGLSGSSGSILGPPTFDPYSTDLSGTATSGSLLGPPTATSSFAGSTLGGVTAQPPVGGAASAPLYGPAYPPTTPPAVFPNGVAPLAPPAFWPQDPNSGQIQWGAPLKFIIGPRLRHTWVYGEDDPGDLQTHDSEIGVAFAFPNFLFSTQPLYVVPTFGLHLWDGPQFLPNADLPSKAYDAYVDFGWMTDPAKPIGAELGLRAGVFTDFDTFVTKSFRFQAQGFGRVRLTPTLEARFGVMWIDRAQIKLLPAGGLIWTPNPRARYEIDFPSPKLAHYLTTVGSHDIWGYVSAEYGGGTWTIERADGTSDRIDINDIRLMVGLETGPPEFMRQGRRVLFFEAGWVTSREVYYVVNPADTFQPDDTFMVRAGVYY